eukprot:gene27681-7323_t
MSEEDGDLLVLLLDAHLFLDNSGIAPTDLKSFPDEGVMLEQVLYFIGTYLMLEDNNKIAVYAVQDKASHVLYMSLGEETSGCEFGSNYAKSIISRLLLLLEETANSGVSPGPLALSGALSRALCLIHRLRGDHSSNSTTSRGAQVAAAQRRRARVLCIMGSPDVPMQYIPVMNAIFSAQRAEVSLDAVVLGSSDSSLLQQAVHLTGGLYLRPSHPSALLQYLVQTASADTHTRSLLALHQPLGVDFRASCFCHKRTIDRGFVCSVCLSIFCQQSPECSICGTVFDSAPSTKASQAKPQH